MPVPGIDYQRSHGNRVAGYAETQRSAAYEPSSHKQHALILADTVLEIGYSR